MAPPDRLCSLKVRVSGHDDVKMLATLPQHPVEKILHLRFQIGDGVFYPEFHVRGHLVIPRSPRMQLPSRLFPDDFSEASLVRSMDVFIRRLDWLVKICTD